MDGRRWRCVGSYACLSYDGNATRMFPNVPKNAVAALITVRLSSLDYSTSPSLAYGSENGNTIPAGTTTLIEGSCEYLESLYCAGEPEVTTTYTTYFGV